MSIERTKSKQKVKEPKTKITWKEIKRQKVLLFWAAIMVVYLSLIHISEPTRH